MTKMKSGGNPTISNNTHVGLLHKSSLARTCANWHSPGAESKKRQPNLCGSASLNFVKNTSMIKEEVLIDGADIYTNGVPK